MYVCMYVMCINHFVYTTVQVQKRREPNSSSSRRQGIAQQPDQHFGKRHGTAKVSPDMDNPVKSTGTPSVTDEGGADTDTDKAESKQRKQEQASDSCMSRFGPNTSFCSWLSQTSFLLSSFMVVLVIPGTEYDMW